jgi:serine/threonine-protein kinase RsbW
MPARPYESPLPFARTTVFSSKDALRPVQAWVKEFARGMGVHDEDLPKIELAVEEAFMSIVQSAFAKDEQGEITVLLEERHGELVIALEDKGLPIDLEHLEKDEQVALNFVLLKQLMDRFVFVNRGKEGKRVELVKTLPAASVAEAIADEESAGHGEEDNAAAVTEQLLFRMLRPDETLPLAQLAYRCYGYTYASSDFYCPDRTREKMENGVMDSCGAINARGEIVGSLSLFYDSRDAKVAECAAAMVDPGYRGHSLFKEMKQLLFEHAKGKGLYGVFSEAVTIHPYTQQGNLSLGSHEAGILLSYVLDTLAFRKIGAGHLGQRQALVLFYSRLNPEPMRQVYAPPIYKGIIERIYGENGMNRVVVEVPEREYHARAMTELEIRMRSDSFNDAFIVLHRIGDDAYDQILRHTRGFCEEKSEAIYLEIPMESREGAIIAERLAEKGFIFAGVIPELRGGDILRLQYLNNVLFDRAKVIVVSDTAKEMLAFIADQYENRP